MLRFIAPRYFANDVPYFVFIIWIAIGHLRIFIKPDCIS